MSSCPPSALDPFYSGTMRRGDQAPDDGRSSLGEPDPLNRPDRAAHWHSRPHSSPFGEDVPVPGARAALLLLGQREKLEAGEERGKTVQVAIVVRVRLGVATAD